MNEKGITGRGNSRSKDRKWSVKRWARKGQGGKNQKKQYLENAWSEWRETGQRSHLELCGRRVGGHGALRTDPQALTRASGLGFVLQWQQLISINSSSQLFSAFSNPKFYQAPQFWVLLSAAQLLTLRSHRKGKPTRGGQRQGISTVPVTHFLDPFLLFTKESSPPDEHRHLLLPLFIYSFHPKFIKCLCQAGRWNTKFLILNNLLSDSRITYKITR